MLNKSKINLNRFTKIFTPLMFVISFIYFGVFRYMVIPSGDDYFWGGAQGNYLLHHMFYGPQAIYGGSSNGRYLGNTLEIFTMRHISLAILAYAIFWTLLLWGLWRLSGKTIASLVLSFLFVFTLQDAYLNNILVWNAGFVNYVPPIALMLVYIWLVDIGKEKQFNQFMPLVTLALAYVTGLFTETLTIAQIFLGVFVLIYFKKNIKAYHVTYLLGAIVAAITVFSHPGYRGQSTYRNTTFDLVKIWNNYSKITHFWLITFNIALVVGILLAIIILIVKSKLPMLEKSLLTLVTTAFLVYYIAINFYLKKFQLNDMYGYNTISDKISNVEGIVSLLFVAFIGYCIFLFFKTDAKMWLYYLMTGVIMGQLLFVSAPINCRGNFLTYVFTYLIAMKFVLAALDKIKLKTVIVSLLFAGLLIVGFKYQSIMYVNHQANLIRVNNPEFYNGKVDLTKHVPYRKFVWFNDLLNQQNPTYWKNYLKK